MTTPTPFTAGARAAVGSILATTLAFTVCGPAATVGPGAAYRDATSLASGVLAADLDADVLVTTASVNNAWWVANALSINTGEQLIETVFYEQLLMEIYLRDPSMPPLKATKQVRALQDAVGKVQDFALTGSAQGDQLVPSLLSIAQTVMDDSTVSKAVLEATKVVFQRFTDRSLAQDANGYDQIARTQDMALNAVNLYHRAPEILSDAINMAKEPGQQSFRAAHDTLFASTTAPVAATAQQMIAANPRLQELQAINNLVATTGQIRTDLGSLRQLTQDTMSRILAEQAKAQETLDSINAKQDVILAYVADEAQRQREADEAARKAADAQKTLRAMNAGVQLLSTLIGQVDPAAGKAVAVVGSAAIQVGSAIWEFATVAAKMGGAVEALTSVAGLALTGNLVGAALSLLPLFMDSGPTPDQMILEQLAAMRQQIAALGDRMEQRFDHIDRSLATIFQATMTEFARINATLGHIEGGVEDMQRSLVTLHTRLTSLEGGIWGSLSDGYRRPFWERVDYALGHQRRTEESLTRADYLNANSSFYTFATRHAYDQAATGPDNRDYTELNVGTELAKYPLVANLDYLAKLPRTYGLPGLASSDLPNANDWYAGARAYIALALNNPQRAVENQALTAEVTDLHAAGQRLQSFERNIVDGGSQDYRGRTLNPLFATLLQRYDQHADALATSLEARGRRFIDDLALDPFAPPTSDTLGRRPSELTGSTCGATQMQLSPGAVNNALGPELRILQDWAHQGRAEICISGAYVPRNTRVDLVATVTAYWTPSDSTTRTVARTARLTLASENRCPANVRSLGPMEPPDLPDLDCVHPRSGVDVSGNREQLDSWLSSTAHSSNATSTQIRHDADNWLASVREAYAATLARVLLDDAGRDAANGMHSAIRAVEAYAQLGLPGALAGDEVLQAMLRGDQGVLLDGPGEGGITSWLHDPANRGEGQDPLTSLKEQMRLRVEALATALENDLPLARDEHDGSTLTATAMWRLESLVDTVSSKSASFTPPKATRELRPTKIGTSRTRVLTVQNTGLAPMKISEVKVRGTGFTLADSTCGRVPGGHRCTITVKFSPTTIGRASAKVSVVANTPTGGAYTIVAGRGTRS